jgi:hypothetical protein
MSTTTQSEQPSRSRWRHRLVALAAVPAVVTGLVVVTTAGPASAVQYVPVPCPAGPFDVTYQNGNLSVLAKPIVIAATKTFAKSDGRDVLNELDFPIVATFTSSVSKTHTVTQTIALEFTMQTLVGTFKRSVSDTVTDSKTTQIGISATVTVPPHSLLIGDYGIVTYDIIYDAHQYLRVRDKCVEAVGSTLRAFTVAPTVDEAWRFRLG